ncbi:kinase domain protein [Ancylostoma duodenale]|uniref:Stress-activated protein kinase JNK n=1 Tax=Ancylostoma duodenale TaxID=51022 RepID=A0A0C2BT39_9BILA|nr:kinase domain protein [Ancylostoma duodenale]
MFLFPSVKESILSLSDNPALERVHAADRAGPISRSLSGHGANEPQLARGHTQTSVRFFTSVIEVALSLFAWAIFQVHYMNMPRFRLDHKTLSFFVYQMLCAIKHLHTSGVIHRDLKPSNIVVNDKCILKVLDFGLARKKTVDSAMRMSDYVVTRYYRAPEVILGLPYSEKVDIWSVGCIFAEMINHRVLFPGLDRVDQWTKIINVMGTPSEDFISKLGSSATVYVRSLPHQTGIPIEQIAPDSSFLKDTENPRANLTAECGRDLLSKMLIINPDNRYSVEESLNHPYVKVWYREEEVNAPQSENRYKEEIDYADKPLSEWKELIFDEVKQYERQHNIFES